MARLAPVYLAFNRGIVSRLGLARADIKRLALSAQRMVNWMPRVLGSMMLRPGLGHLGSTFSDGVAKLLEFVFAADDTALVEVSNLSTRVWVNDALVQTNAVQATISNGYFSLDVSGWSSYDETSASSGWAVGYMYFTSNGTAAAQREQEVPFADVGVVHHLEIDVHRGPVTLKIGSGDGMDDVLSPVSLESGNHVIGFTPTASINGTVINAALTRSGNTVTYTTSQADQWASAYGGFKYQGRWYFEAVLLAGSFSAFGLSQIRTTTAYAWPGETVQSWGYHGYAGLIYNGSFPAGVPVTAHGVGSVIGIAYDCAAQTATFYLDNVQQAVIGGIAPGVWPALGLYQTGSSAKLCLTSGECVYSPPPGYAYWGGSFFVRFYSRLDRMTLVNSCRIATGGALTIPSPWTSSDLDMIRYAQSGDVLFVACEGRQQRRIERRSNNSWSVVKYLPPDGPFRIENLSRTTLTPSAISGNITLTASTPIFQTGHLGALFRLTSEGQRVERSVTAQDTWSDAIRITGVSTERGFSVIISGTWGATVTLQRSLDQVGDWLDVQNYAVNQTVTFSDGLDNQIAYYRIGIKTGMYGFGTANLALSYGSGSISGVVRITGVTSPTVCSAEVVKALGGTTATDVWAEGEWSDYRGWPTAVAFHEGRLWWAGKDGIWGSVSDAFDSFDPDYEGDAGPIARTIGSGPVDTINWLLPMQRLLLGGEGSEFSAKSSSFDEPLTPTNFQMKSISTQGSARVPAVKVDGRGLFVQRGGVRVFELAYDAETYDYGSNHVTVLHPEIGSPGIVRIAVQRQPDTRLHCVRSDGTVAILVYDKAENVLCWSEFETDGAVEDAACLPSRSGELDDAVYYIVRRTINGAERRFLERWAQERECRGATVNKLADCHTAVSGTALTTVSGLSHLEGKTVTVWADGAYAGTKVVANGLINLSTPATNVVVGLSYEAQWQSSKLAQLESIALTRNKQIQGLGLILADVHAKGLKFGPDFNTLDDLPEIHEGGVVGANDVREEYDQEPFVVPGMWKTDSRLCLQATAPKPCTVLAAVVDGETV